jgi:hypothetical protein
MRRPLGADSGIMSSLFSDSSLLPSVFGRLSNELRRLYDAVNFAFAARCADPDHHFDRTCQPLLIAPLIPGSLEFAVCLPRREVAVSAARTTHFVMLAQAILYPGGGSSSRMATIRCACLDWFGLVRLSARALPKDDRHHDMSRQ